MTSIPLPPSPFTDGAVSLRPSAERDIPEILIAYQDDPALHHRLGQDRPPSGAELGRREELAEARRQAGETITLTILQAGEDLCVGQIDVHAVDWENQRAELGVWVAPQLRGRGLARRALALTAQWLLTECGLARVGVMTEPENRCLVAAVEAAGFRREGILRGYTLERGRRVDNLVLSVVRSDLAG